MMFTVSKEVEFDAGHRVPNHLSKCASPHGHRYRCRATWEGELVERADDPEAGMVVDFGELKRLLTLLVHDPYDHAFIVQDTDDTMRAALAHVPHSRVVVVPFPPTAEQLAARIFEDLRGECEAQLIRVELWETPTSVATVEAP